jgi:glycosyltransferase involved in cell wall biosynthesis
MWSEWASGWMLRISAVIPAHNEESTVGEIVQGCMRYCDEVLVVDDASSDMTSQVARAAGATVTRNRANLGIVRSTEIGLRLASQEVVVTLDADGQHDPSEIPSVVRPIAQDLADLVLGKREHDRPLSEQVISALTGLRVKCEDVGTGYRAFRGDLAHRIRLWGFCLCGSLVLEAQRQGARIVEVPITIKPRKAGKSHWPSPLSRGTVHCKQAVLLAWHLIM